MKDQFGYQSITVALSYSKTEFKLKNNTSYI